VRFQPLRASAAGAATGNDSVRLRPLRATAGGNEISDGSNECNFGARRAWGKTSGRGGGVY
jgi:hypothetical protein